MAKTQETQTITPQAVEDAALGIGAIAERSRGFYENALKTWSEESHAFFEAMARDGAAAFEQLQACKSPVDVIGVEQAWLAARSKAYMDAGRRIMEAGAQAAATTAANEAPGFRLPE
jgi:hypothetical protein